MWSALKALPHPAVQVLAMGRNDAVSSTIARIKVMFKL